MKFPAPNPTAQFDADGLSLGPDLPIATYHAVEPWHAERIRALAVYCSDGRWGEAFDEFCQKHLLIPRYDRLAIPGGPACLVDSEANSTLQQAAHSHLDFLVRAHELDQVVLITHYGCAMYSQRLQRPADDCLAAQIDDVRAAAKILRSWYSKLRVKGFLAMRQEGCLSFHELSL